MVIACLIILYFFRQNLLGIRESSEQGAEDHDRHHRGGGRAAGWCCITLAVRGPANRVPLAPDLRPRSEYADGDRKGPVTGLDGEVWKTGPQTRHCGQDGTRRSGPPAARARRSTRSPAGRKTRWGSSPASGPDLAAQLRHPGNWLSIIGVIGLLLAFAHSILAMSGVETLAQVYREVESPKLPNFKKAAMIVFLYSLVLTASVSFLAVLLIPNDVRMKLYSDNLIGGLAMYVVGPPWSRLVLNAFGRGRRLPDPLRRGQHGDHRLQRRAESGGRGRRDARLVPQAPPPLRHHLPRAYR